MSNMVVSSGRSSSSRSPSPVAFKNKILPKVSLRELKENVKSRASVSSSGGHSSSENDLHHTKVNKNKASKDPTPHKKSRLSVDDAEPIKALHSEKSSSRSRDEQKLEIRDKSSRSASQDRDSKDKRYRSHNNDKESSSRYHRGSRDLNEDSRGRKIHRYRSRSRSVERHRRKSPRRERHISKDRERHYRSRRRRSRSRGNRRSRSFERRRYDNKSSSLGKYRKRSRSLSRSRSCSKSPVRSKGRSIPSNTAKIGALPLCSTTGAMTPQMALQQTMAAMSAKAQALTGVELPKYYNPAAVNPIKYAEQVQKRKLLWQPKEKAEEPSKTNVWDKLTFNQDQDGKMTAKFRKLMGIKGEEVVPVDEQAEVSSEPLQNQEELFRNLDQQYEMARMSTHTHRGVGLGYSSQTIFPPVQK